MSDIRSMAQDIAFEYALTLPDDRFSGDTPGNATMTITSAEFVDMIEKVLTGGFMTQEKPG